MLEGNESGQSGASSNPETPKALHTIAVLFLFGIAPQIQAQGINVCGSNCDPPGYGACPNPEETYFSKVARGECLIDDRFTLSYNEWKKKYDREAAIAQAEQERRDARIAAEIKRLGPHREAEARRLVEMREAAERARPKSVNPTPFDEVNGDQEPTCRLVTGQGTQKVPFNFTSKQAAESALRFDASGSCKRSPNAGNSPIFSSLVCESTQGTGLISGEQKTFWSCTGSFTCSMPHEVCEGKSSQGSKQ